MRYKGQRRFSRSEDGLSAVLAVVMLIGVVILLAVALTLMLIILIDDQPESAPVIGFAEYEDEDRWLLTTAPREIPWSRYEMRAVGTSSAVKVRLNADAGVSGFSLSAKQQVLPSSLFPGDLAGGQFLDFCAPADEYNVRVIMVHSKSESVSQQHAFSWIPGDPTCV